MANTSIYNAFSRFWQHVLSALGNKADASHTHSDLQTQINNKANTSDLAFTNITMSQTASNTYLAMTGYNVKKQLNQVFGYVYLETKSDIVAGANLVRFPAEARPAVSYYTGLFNYTDKTIVGAGINTNGYIVNSTALSSGKVYVVNFSFYVA